ncbi:hypothetical protein TNCV_1006231 [Trichonephila clavipes]|nr:hypothetical protein TNCV_1006231 [Trichonephila clavipes]
MLVCVYEDKDMPMKCVYEWFPCFRDGRESVSGLPRGETPAPSDSDENIKKDGCSCLPSAQTYSIGERSGDLAGHVGRHILEDIVGRIAQYVDEH